MGRVDIVPAGRPRSSLPDVRLLAIIGLAVVLAAAAWAATSMLSSDEDEPEPVAAVAVANPDDAKKDRFIARGDRLCAQANRRQERLLYPDSPDDFVRYLDDVRATLVGLITDLKKLPQPKQDRGLLKRMFAQVDKLPPVLSEARAAAADGDVAGVQRIVAKGERIEHHANALALQYGFVECSQP